jgi:hypothetical protein
LEGVKPADLAVFKRVIDQLTLNVENQTSSTAQTGASSK